MSASEPDVLAIDTIRRKLEAAENANDPEAAAVHFTDDVVLMVPDYPIQEGKPAAVAFMHDVMGWVREYLDRHIQYVSAEVAVLGDVAFDRGTFSFVVSAKSGGAPETVTGKYFWLLTRDAREGWRVSRLIVSRDDPPETESAEDIAC